MMDLWIRTQDRMRLVKANRLAIKGESKLVGLGDWYITESQNSLRYATYSTKERALEVLDEIQQTIKQQEFVKLTFSKIPPQQYDINEEKIDRMFGYFVYEMPTE